MELMGIADEGAVTIDGQIEVTQALGWKWIESRFVEVEGFEKGSIHEIPDAAFDVVAAKLEESGVGIYAFGATICNWQKTVETPFDVTLAEVARAIPRMKRLGTKYVRIMSFKPADDADTTPPEVFERVGEVTRRFLDEGLQPVHENCMNHGGMSWQHAEELLAKVPWGMQCPWEFWEHMREHTAHIHIKDAVKAGEGEEYHFPGEGDGRVRDILKDAFANGYDAGISIEPHMTVVFHDTDGGPAPEEAMAENYIEYGRRLEKLIGEVQGELAAEQEPATV
jgi:sugar phosphate isomerase/epimerase